MKDDPSSAVHTEHRRLAAIMFTDLVDFSRQMGTDEARMLRTLAVHNQVIEQAVAAHQGHVIKTAGDGFLVEFPSVVHAVQCAQHIQAQFRTHNAEKGEPIHVRIGIHLGDIIVQSTGDVLGDGVNIASRLQAFAEPDTVCISDMVYRDVAQKMPLGTVVSLGRPRLKNITQRFPVYALLSEPPSRKVSRSVNSGPAVSPSSHCRPITVSCSQKGFSTRSSSHWIFMRLHTFGGARTGITCRPCRR